MFQHTAARGRLQLHFLSPNLDNKFQHTAARRRLPNVICSKACGCQWFQHTAARRRLPQYSHSAIDNDFVSTHSRPKAAAAVSFWKYNIIHSFNTQPLEGGCNRFNFSASSRVGFNTQPPEGGCQTLINLTLH